LWNGCGRDGNHAFRMGRIGAGDHTLDSVLAAFDRYGTSRKGRVVPIATRRRPDRLRGSSSRHRLTVCRGAVTRLALVGPLNQFLKRRTQKKGGAALPVCRRGEDGFLHILSPVVVYII